MGNWTLRRFQERIMDSLQGRKDALLVAPTGSGKTLTLLLGEEGAVGVYPNNKLLLDQQRSIDKILKDALRAKLVYNMQEGDVDVLRIYELSTVTRDGPPIISRKRVAVVLLSGKYIGYERDEEGNLLPKRQVVLRNIVDRICYITEEPYTITLTTPDTALLVMAGMYRDFEKVGYTIHDAILSALEGKPIDHILSRTRVATATGGLVEIGQIRQCLLKHPWLIDEFHLYGAYEASGLIPILKVYRDYAGWEKPVILSSATPKGALYERLVDMLKPTTIDAETSNRGDPASLVRGDTEVEVVHLDIKGRGKWFKVGDYLPATMEDKVPEIKQVLSSGGRVFIVTDRINQIPPIVDVLIGKGLQPECGVSLPPPGCSDREELLLVGSESVSQGIDRPNVRYGIITGYNWATLIQRFGRIGRKTSSKIVIVTPARKSRNPLSSLHGKTVSYEEFVDTVKADFPNIEMELPNTRGIRTILETRETLLEYTATIAFAQVSRPKGVFDALSKHLARHGDILNYFLGPPESIVNITMFRSSGFEVLVKHASCPGKSMNGCSHTSDIASILRNYIVYDVKPTVYRTPDGITKKMVKVTIDYTPGRQVLVLEPSPQAREDLGDLLAGTITTLGELADLGFKLYIRLPHNSGETGLEVPIVGPVRDQVVALVKASEEVATYLTYTVRAIQVHRGEAKTLVALLL